MFSFFKRLIGKSTDSDIDIDTDKPGENEAGDVVEARSQDAEGLQHAGTPATAREGVAASDRASEAPLRGTGAAQAAPRDSAAPIGNGAPAGTTPSASSASLPRATTPVTPVQPIASTARVAEPTRTEAPDVAAAGTPTPTAQTSPANATPQPASPAATTTPETKPYWQGRTTSQWKAPAESVEIVPPPEPEASAKRTWLTRLKTGLSKTSSGLTGIFVGAKIDEDLYEELETALLMSDAGVDATEYLLEALREKVRSERLTDSMQVKAALRSLLADLLRPLEKSLMLGRAQPLVMMIAGVNGAGKTTSIGKLAKHLQRFDQSVLLAAGDTFRAAAREQLTVWGQRNNVTVVSQESGDAAAVIFDAVGAARARKIDVMMADTAGRLPTQLHLMEELRKVKRVIAKAQPDAPHEVLLVIDANTGQNALAQVKSFDDALGLTGLIVTKLDGTAKGGILAAIARQRPIPVYFIGVGEKVEDLQPFSADEFADALLGN
ncbi:signal recognition particle-docking protein FtsY [Caballeronia sordidicola]|uniref:signal recognition particle-docking protein FtsY n=1 Tax=Caballeronia sordidicola TaxID=196367 RepID=UPI000A86CB24|nr:signal recognition particle-docking protein FtsY [Caballeronia sordidicola]